MRLLPLLVVLTLVSTVYLVDDITAHVISPTCMSLWMYKVGIPHAKVVKYERNMVEAGMTEKAIISTPAFLLKFLLRSDTDEARAIQDCVAKRSDKCSQYEPCENEGKCQLNGRRDAYVCVCHSDFTGRFCRTPHPAQASELRALEKVVSKLRKKSAEAEERLKAAEDKLKHRPTGCNSRSLGHKYQSRQSKYTEQRSGAIATMSFQKKYTSTVLRLSYSSNIRVEGGHHTTARWYFMIDGQECRKPTTIDIALYNNNGDNDHYPAVLLGICEQSGAGPIGKGMHTIAVHVGKTGKWKFGNPGSNWQSTSFMEVQELCPQS